MQSAASVVRRTCRAVSSALLLLLFASVAEAQTGRITGIVTDSSQRFPVNGVAVSIPGTGRGATTGDDGRYTITAVPPGTYTVEVRRLGYAPTRRTGVVVTADQGYSLARAAVLGGAAPLVLEPALDQHVEGAGRDRGW